MLGDSGRNDIRMQKNTGGGINSTTGGVKPHRGGGRGNEGDIKEIRDSLDLLLKKGKGGRERMPQKERSSGQGLGLGLK